MQAADGEGPVSIYYGTVRDRHVVLEGDAAPVEGQRVEVRPVGGQERVLELLRADGLLDDQSQVPGPPDPEYLPIVVRGRPLSEQIIGERR